MIARIIGWPIGAILAGIDWIEAAPWRRRLALEITGAIVLWPVLPGWAVLLYAALWCGGYAVRGLFVERMGPQ